MIAGEDPAKQLAAEQEEMIAENKKKLTKLLQHVASSNRCAEEQLLKIIVEVCCVLVNIVLFPNNSCNRVANFGEQHSSVLLLQEKGKVLRSLLESAASVDNKTQNQLSIGSKETVNMVEVVYQYSSLSINPEGIITSSSEECTVPVSNPSALEDTSTTQPYSENRALNFNASPVLDAQNIHNDDWLSHMWGTLSGIYCVDLPQLPNTSIEKKNSVKGKDGHLLIAVPEHSLSGINWSPPVLPSGCKGLLQPLTAVVDAEGAFDAEPGVDGVDGASLSVNIVLRTCDNLHLHLPPTCARRFGSTRRRSSHL
jgi:hypothetical protein